MQKLLLLGDEALAQGALDAGLSGVYSYPGTPSTEITEYIQSSKEAAARGVHRKWCTNEKTAVEGALGMSYAGKRTITCMKHVGLNVAADPFMNSGVTGANGGLIVAVADDPSMHSSQNEQDSRFYGKFAMIPVLEPSDQQECYDMAEHAFELSEKYGKPVLMRLTTRLSHSRAGVNRGNILPEKEMKLPADPNQFMLLPAFARIKYGKLLELQKNFVEEAENSPFNVYTDGEDKNMGIIACGLGYNYLMENYLGEKCPYPVLKISQYPLPEKQLKKMRDECDSILVIEEGMPLVEGLLKGFFGEGKPIKGRLSGALPRAGELNPNIVATALGRQDTEGEAIPELVAKRPPMLCVGCPHIDSYNALNTALEKYGPGRVFADIGCYTLGFLPPYNAINTCVDMGASITMAKGASDAGLFPSVAVIGDSTFTHSGMTGLLDAVNDGGNIVVMILDNDITAMTGGQESSCKGKIEDICRGIGVLDEHIHVINPLKKNHDEFVALLEKEFAFDGVSVIIPRRVCVVENQKRVRRKKAEAAK